MARKPELKDPVSINLQIELEDKTKLYNKVPNVSEFLRSYINDFVNTTDNLNDLKNDLINLKNQRDNILIEIELLENKIRELEKTYKENENNKNILENLMITIKSVSSNEFNNNGITKTRIREIANNKINPNSLIKECEKQGIKIIKDSQKTNSNIITAKKGVEKPGLETIIKAFFREWKSQHTKTKYKTKERFLNNKTIKEKYYNMCTKKGVDFNTFKEYVLTNDK